MGSYLRSVLPLGRLPLNKCFGLKSGMCLSPSPLRAALPALRCCLSAILTALFRCTASLRPDPALTCARLALRPLDMPLQHVHHTSDEHLAGWTCGHGSKDFQN